MDEYAQPMKVALLCVTQMRLTFDAARANETALAAFSNVASLRRETGRSPLHLSIRHSYRIEQLVAVGSPRQYFVNTLGWQYTILDQDQHEILAYHWHPDSLSTTTTPHFHVGSTLLDTTGHELGKTFSRLHLPSGKITVVDVVTALIEEFDVIPIHQRWDETLQACQEAIQRQHATT